MTTDIRLEDTKVVVQGPLHAAEDTFVPIKIWVGGLAPYKTEMMGAGKELTHLRDAVTALQGQLADLQVAATIDAEAAHFTQDGWRWCSRCRIVHFAPNRSRGVCVDKLSHSTEGSGEYTLFPNKSRYTPNQPNWQCCRKCQGLFIPDGSNLGQCMAGGAHERTGSVTYVLCHTTAPAGIATQDGWRFCGKCRVLFHGDNNGACPGSGTHTASGSVYMLAHRGS
jgi:hypothetical protein